MASIGEQHAILTEDQSVWVNFYGAVPRVGESVYVDGQQSPMRVESVTWYVLEWSEPDGRVARSAARVLVVPSEEKP